MSVCETTDCLESPQINSGEQIIKDADIIVVDSQQTVVSFVPLTINDLFPEVFQLIIAMFLRTNNWRKLIPLRVVSHFWRKNIDSYLSSRTSFQYTGRTTTGPIPPIINYFEFHSILHYYPNMTNLVIKNFQLSDHLASILRRNVPKLERLTLDKCPNMSWKGITILAVRFNHLKFLDISNCDIGENRMGILVENLQNLRILKAINPGREVTFQCLSKLSPRIEDIWIGLKHMPDCNTALKALVSGNGKNLQHLGLVINNFNSTDWSVITNNMKQLKSLKLTFGSFKASSLKEFAKLKNLEFLVLGENSHNNKVSVLTDESVLPVIRGCSQLKSLNFAGTRPNTCRLTYRSMVAIHRLCKNLEQIRFLNSNYIDDDCLSKLAYIPTLLVLHLSTMRRITNEGIIEFVKASKRCRNFRICDCPNVNEEVIDVFIEVAKKRNKDQFKLFIEGMVVSKDLRDLPTNLMITFTDKKRQSGDVQPNLNTDELI